MQIKLICQTVPARNFPFQLTNLNASTITQKSTPLTIIRSPHIDKKSREQFKFFKRKNIIIKHITKTEEKTIKTIIETFKQQKTLIRFTLIRSNIENFSSTF